MFLFRLKTSAPVHQHFSPGSKQQMRPSEVTDIDQPLYDWGIENRMEQYYNAAPAPTHFANQEEPIHEVNVLNMPIEISRNN